MTEPVRLAAELAPRLADRAAAYDATAAFPVADMHDLRATGLLGLLVPKRLSGMGAGFSDYVAVAQELSRGSASTALLFNMHASVTGSLAMVPEDLARELGAGQAFFAHRDAVLEAAVDGAWYGVAITERAAGSRLSAVQTTYQPVDGGYHIRGQKTVCSGAGHLDAYLVAARTAEDVGDDGDPRVSHFLVPAGPGLHVEENWNPLGMRATASNGLHLAVTVPSDALLGGVEGLAVLLAYVMPQWLVASYAAVYVGLARAAVDEAVRYLLGRTVAGEKGGLAHVGFVRGRVGRADAHVESARMVLEDAARRIDEAPGDPDTNQAIYRAKLLAGDVAMDVSSSMAEACGLGALQRGNTLERIFRDARSGALMPPSSDVCADVLGTAAFQLDPQHGSDVKPW